MNKVVVSFPDGNGCFGTESFWKDYLSAIGCEYHDKQMPLYELCSISNKVFPKNTCVNSKYRLGRALLLGEKATHFIMFLREDIYVSNCPSSVYRINWIRDYFKNIKVIVWKRDILPNENDAKNLIKLADMLGANPKDAQQFISAGAITELPRRNAVYNLSLDRLYVHKKTVLLIGVAPHLVDKYRRSTVMDYIYQKVNLIDPMSYDSNCLLTPKHNNEIVFYKDNAILESCDYFLENKIIDGIIFVSDPFDIPGRYSFPKYQFYLHNKGIYEYNKSEGQKISYLNITVSINNQHLVTKQLEEYFDSL